MLQINLLSTSLNTMRYMKIRLENNFSVWLPLPGSLKFYLLFRPKAKGYREWCQVLSYLSLNSHKLNTNPVRISCQGEWWLSLCNTCHNHLCNVVFDITLTRSFSLIDRLNKIGHWLLTSFIIKTHKYRLFSHTLIK